LNSWRIFPVLGLIGCAFAACGPDHKPDQPCDGPTFNLVVTAESGPLPADTRINVRYGGNQDGESYTLGHPRTPQAVFCVEDHSTGGASSDDTAGGAAGVGGAASTSSGADDAVQRLSCRLYTQGPARLDVTATGYVPIDDRALSLDDKLRCEVPEDVVLLPEKPDAGT
jgi:hypothetical protein